MNHEILTSHFSIPASFRPQLKKNYLLHWSGDYFSHLFSTHSGRIKHQDTLYQVIFDPSTSEREVLSSTKVQISFRSINGITGYALVKPD